MWKTYTEQLLDDIRISEYTHDDDVYGPSILRFEVETAVRSLKNDKPGSDNIQGEILKLMCETDNQFFDHHRGKFSEDWLQSTFIAIPKKM